MLAVGIMSLAGVGLTGCILKECTTAGCTPFLRAKLDQPSGWEDGRWRIEMIVDGSVFGACEIELHDSNSPGDDECTDALELRVDREANAITSATARLPHDGVRPTEYTVRVERDGQPVAEQTFDADYETYWPNGRSCGGGCDQAEAEMSF
jgi:hypothetical protein